MKEKLTREEYLELENKLLLIELRWWRTSVNVPMIIKAWEENKLLKAKLETYEAREENIDM